MARGAEQQVNVGFDAGRRAALFGRIPQPGMDTFRNEAAKILTIATVIGVTAAHSENQTTRRNFLKIAGGILAAETLAGCAETPGTPNNNNNTKDNNGTPCQSSHQPGCP